jgi:hypothetical protein
MSQNCSTSKKPGTIKEFFTSWYFWKPFLGIILGGIAGFLYFHFVGCKSGTCAITGNPFSSIIAGSFLGFIVSNSPCLRGSCASDEKGV